MPTVRTDDGIDLNYVVDDFRPPWEVDRDHDDHAIFFHHGWSRNLTFWNQWVPLVATQYKVVRYDCRGCGQSSVPGEDAVWSAERIVRDVGTLFDHLGLKSIDWIGFESGGIFGIVFAATYPDRARSLSLLNTPHTLLREPMTLYRQGFPLASEAIAEVGLAQWVRQTMPNRMDLTVAPPELVEWHIQEQAKTSPSVAINLLRFIEKTDVVPLLRQVVAPTLLITGNRSPNCPLEDQESMQDEFPAARPLVVLPDIGPGIQLLRPEQCASEVLSFLDSLQA